MRKPIEDIDNRRPVWLALSNLFLDTDTNLFKEQIIKTLSNSPYSISELDEIMQNEVYPVCYTNLYGIAGEWSGFDPEWLEKKILKGPSLFRKIYSRSIGKISIMSSLQWKLIKREIQTARKITNT